jgi:hypothetical protein
MNLRHNFKVSYRSIYKYKACIYPINLIGFNNIFVVAEFILNNPENTYERDDSQY